MSNAKGFTKQFGDRYNYVCDGDSITCDIDGFDFTATIHHDECSDKPDERQDGFWPSLDPNNDGYIGAKSKSTLARHMAKAQSVMDAWKNDEWWYVGVAVTVSRRGVELTDKYNHALWGIECNYPGSDNSYLLKVANELLPEAMSEARKALKNLCNESEVA